ncbi:unnamed protein product [Trichobilharzia regenti]|nr:unnamed protein product [Trichobilharzia regenti]
MNAFLFYFLPTPALLNASRKGTTEHHIRSLLKAGASIQAIDKYGRSCLHLAAKFGRDKVVEYLLKQLLRPIVGLFNNSQPRHHHRGSKPGPSNHKTTFIDHSATWAGIQRAMDSKFAS